MISKGNKRAFTLAEIMIVVLILTIIFAILAPILAKRMSKESANPWNWVRPMTNLNAYFKEVGNNTSGSAYFGITPTVTSSDDFSPYSKVILRSSPWGDKIQKQIHFRYGYEPIMNNAPSAERKDTIARIGENSGSWLMDTRNILIGGTYPDLLPIGNNAPNYSPYEKDYPDNNISLGYNALNLIHNKCVDDGSGNCSVMDKVNNNIAIGYLAGSSIENAQNNLYIGYKAGKSTVESKGQTFIGSSAGENNLGDSNTAIGYKAGYKTSSNVDSHNVFVGYYAGGFDRETLLSHMISSTGIGSYALTNLRSGSNNVAIGYNALRSITQGNNNVAIGHSACSGFSGILNNKICIGADSGLPRPSVDNVLNSSLESIYIGNKPKNFEGKAVLEIHNTRVIDDTNKNKYTFGDPSKPVYALNNFPQIVGKKSTTIVNGNLIVRGRTFLTVGDYLYNFKKTKNGYEGGSEIKADGSIENSICAKNPLSYTFGDEGDTDPDVACPRIIYNFPNSPSFSDRRLKNIGSKSKSGLTEIAKLKVFNYIFKDDKNKTPQVGVIAQDLQKIFPNSVIKNKNGFLSIKLDEMFYAAINAIKELDKKIISLAKKLYKVEATISKLEKENTELKADVETLTIRVQKIKASRGL